MFSKTIIFSTVAFVFFCTVMIGILWSLDVSKSEVKHSADIIVSLGGGIGSRVKKAWDLQTKGYARSDKILITGIPLNPETVINIHPRLKYLKDHPEIHYEGVSILETKNSWEEVRYIKQYMQRHDYYSVIIVTHPLHSGRVKMSLDHVAHFKDSGLKYTIIGDREIDFWNNFLKDKKFREYALSEVVKRLGYEVKALAYNMEEGGQTLFRK